MHNDSTLERSAPTHTLDLPTTSTWIEAAAARFQRRVVNPLVAEAAGDERLSIRVEAAALLDRARAAALGTPRPETAEVGDPLHRLQRCLALQRGLLTCLERARVELELSAGPTATLRENIASSLDEHLERLLRAATGERTALEEALVSLRGVFRNLRDGLLFVDLDGVIVDCNHSIAKATGLSRDEIVGREFRELWFPEPHPEWERLYRQVQETGETQTLYGLEHQPPHAETPIIFDLVIASRLQAGAVVGTVSIVHYRTEQALLERRLVQADKLASVGRLAAGIAHEFRNLLAGVRALAELGAGRPVEATEVFNKIIQVADQATEVTRGLLSFAKRRAPRLEPIEPGALLEGVVALGLTRADRQRLEVRFELEDDLPTLLCDGARVQQALLNLVQNATRAMPTANGVLTLAARRCSEDRIELSVTDTGPGVPRDLRERIFEPFFTTHTGEFGDGVPSRVGAGTGLGLPLVKAVAERHGGEVILRENPAGGACFALRLPVKPAQSVVRLDRAARNAAPPENAPFCAEGFGAIVKASGLRPKVLVVDDEAYLRDILQQVLERAGMAVETIGSVQGAFSLLEDQPFDLLFLDLVVPGMEGPETLEAIRSRFPDLKLAILTGQSLSDEALAEVLARAEAFVEKPFSVDGLLQTVYTVLGDRFAYWGSPPPAPEA